MTGRRRRRGFALIAVVWLLVVAGALAAEFHATTRASGLAAANARAEARARWAARAGRARLLSALDARVARGSGIVPVAGDTIVPPIEFEQGPAVVRAFALDARARVHALRSTSTTMRRLLMAVGLAAGESERILRRLARASRSATHSPASAVRTDSVRDEPVRPFTTISRLGHALGMEPRALARATPYLTVVGDGLVNVNAAPPAVLRSLPWIDAAAAEAIDRRRRRAPYANAFELIASLPRETRRRVRAAPDRLLDRLAFSPRYVELVVTATVEGSPLRIERRSAVILAGNERRPLPGTVEW